MDPWPHPLDRGKEFLLATVSQAHPDELYGCTRLPGQMEEVLVLADEDQSVLSGIAPDLAVGCLSQAQVQNVLATHASAPQEASQRHRELVVNEESHEANSTGW
jgi:hypothetical protein